MKVRETCSCGAQIVLDGVEDMTQVQEWRRDHHCVTPRKVEATGGGQFEIGFALTTTEEPA